MGTNGLKVFAGAIDQAQRSAQNLEAIRQARQKRNQENEAFELNKKKAQLELEGMRLKNSGTAMEQQMLATQLKEYERQQKAIFQGKDALIDQEEHKQSMQGRMAQTVAKQVFNQDPQLQMELAQVLNPGLATAPGPNGGMIQGVPEQSDTPEAMPETIDSMPRTVLERDKSGGFKEGDSKKYMIQRIQNLKARGIPLTMIEEESLFKHRHPEYNRNTVLIRARELAKDAAEQQGLTGVLPENIEAMLPQAEKMLYGESVNRPEKQQKGSITPLKNPVNNKGSNPIEAKAPEGGISRIKVTSPDGKMYTLPENQWEQAKAKGFKRAN